MASSRECDRARQLLMQGMSSAEAGNVIAARRYLKLVLETRCVEFVARAHYQLAALAETPEEKRRHLEYALGTDPTNAQARRELAIMDGRLKREDIVDADALSPAREETPGTAAAHKFACPQCGATVNFDANQKRLACGYCGHRLTILSALKRDTPLVEQDFVVALARESGHQLPPELHTFQCQGCQAAILVSHTLSGDCPYCGSSHVIEIPERAFIPPQAILPFEVPELRARETFNKWVNKKVPGQVKLTRPKGVYLPAWTFELTGEIAWHGTVNTGGNNSQKRPVSGVHGILPGNVVVPATHTLPYALAPAFHKFLLNELVPYDPAYLVNWRTALYEVTVSDASLVARRASIQEGQRVARIRAEAMHGQINDFKSQAKNLTVLSFKSILLPMWISTYRHQGQTYTVTINGQLGRPLGEKPETRWQKFWNRLLG